MSDYFRGSESLATKRYIDKIMLLGLTGKDDMGKKKGLSFYCFPLSDKERSS